MHRKAYEIFTAVVRDGAYANLALKDALAGADRRTAAAVTALVYTAIEKLAYSDFLLSHYAKGRLHGSIRNVLRLAIAELLFMDTPAYAVISGAAELTKAIGKKPLAGYVNGVLRAIARDGEADKLPPLPADRAAALSIEHGAPEFMVREYIAEYGEEFTKELLSKRVHRLCVRAQYPFTREMLEAELSKQGIGFIRSEYDENALVLTGGAEIAELELYKNGGIAVQSESAMLVCRACAVKDGMRVLDACAAPGGKTCYLSSLMHGTGSITAWEKHPHRTALLRAALARLHCTGCTAYTADAAECVPQENGGTALFDVVLCDAPCSGLGGGGKPDAMLARTESDIEALSELQRRILENVCRYVKPGGALVYSTCTVSKRENSDNIAAFLAAHPEFAEESLFPLLPGIRAEGRPKSACGLQLFPNLDGTDGFYMARLIKNGKDENA